MADRLDAVADLSIEIDGHIAHLSGSGSRLCLRIDKPLTVYRHLRQTLIIGRPRDTIAVVARRLDEAGLTVDIVGSNARLCSIGFGQRSRLGPLVAGTGRISPGPLRGIAHALITATVTGLRSQRHRRRR